METWVTILLALIAASPGFTALVMQLLKQRRENKQKEADTAETYERVARSAAEQVMTKNNKIAELEQKIADLTEKVNAMTDQIRALQNERDDLVEKNISLEARVKKLEDILRDNNIPYPD